MVVQEFGMTVSLTGDCMITRRAMIGDDDATTRLVQLIQESDVAFTNLEVLPNDFRGPPAANAGSIHLGAYGRVLDELKRMGLNLFSCANDHSLDFGIEGLTTTIGALESRDLAFAGIGRNLAEARMPTYLDTAAGSVALISCTSTFADGHEAGEQRPDFQGRPGLNPLRFDTVYYITSDHLDNIKEISIALGIEKQRLDRINRGFDFKPDDPEVFPFLGINFRASREPHIHSSPRSCDINAIQKWVREARRRADIVLVSLHAHEQKSTPEQPADFIQRFAHLAIDEGADIVAGHGQPVLRPIEIYRGKPIFYSLGNFIGQNELVYKLPADSFDRFRVDQSETPAEFFRLRSHDDTLGYSMDKRYWQSVVPVCRFNDDYGLDRIELVPITLSLGDVKCRRGQPKLANGPEALEILERLHFMSQPFGTSIVVNGDLGVIRD